MKCNHETIVWWFRGGSKNNPLGSICDFHSKRLIPPKVSVREKEWKSETIKSKWWIFKMATIAREISRASFVLTALHLCAMTARTFCCLPATVAWHPPAAAILIFKPSTKTIVRTEQWKLERRWKNQIWQWLHCTIRKAVFLVPPGLEQIKRFWTRSGRLHKARWEKEANDGLLHASFLLWLFVILFSFHKLF